MGLSPVKGWAIVSACLSVLISVCLVSFLGSFSIFSKMLYFNHTLVDYPLKVWNVVFSFQLMINCIYNIKNGKVIFLLRLYFYSVLFKHLRDITHIAQRRFLFESMRYCKSDSH